MYSLQSFQSIYSISLFNIKDKLKVKKKKKKNKKKKKKKKKKI